MTSIRSVLTCFVSSLVLACQPGLLVAQEPDSGPSDRTIVGSAGSTSTGGGGATSLTGGGGATSSTGDGGATSSTAGIGGTPADTGDGSTTAETDSGPTASTDGGTPRDSGGAETGPSRTECPMWSADPDFEALQLDNTPLGRVYDVWGSADNNYFVALGVETATFPGSSSSLAAIAYFDGLKWTLHRLPPINVVTALSGSATRGFLLTYSQLWVLSSSGQQSTIFKGSSPSMIDTWTTETLDTPANHLVVLKDTDALLSTSSSTNFADGHVQRWNGSQWDLMTMPDLGVVYVLRKLRAVDATHVYALGYSGGANMGSNVFAAFDGAQWRARKVPAECGNLEDVLGVGADRIFTLGNVFATQRRTLCRVSPDLGTWTVLDQSPSGGDNPALVADGRGTVLTVVGTYMSHGPSTVRYLDADLPGLQCTLNPGIGNFVAWSAPGSPNVHIFSGQQAGITNSFARHLVARVDP
jgi:hypothetical protein